MYTELYTSIGGKKGILEELYKSEDFEKALKDLQKTFKKTGKISASNIKDVADECEDLADDIEDGELSEGALAEVNELLG